MSNFRGSSQKKAPSYDEVLEFGEAKGLPMEEVKKWYEAFGQELIDLKGNPIKNWKSYLTLFCGKAKEKPKPKQERKYDEFKPNWKPGGLEAYKNELRMAKDGDEAMRKKYPDWKDLCKQRFGKAL